MPQPDSPLPIRNGELIAGKYAVDRVLGRGGMGFVVAARHKDLGHLVAIKMLLPELTGRPDVVERFLREARAAVQLRSEHAVRVMDVGLHQSRGSAAGSPRDVPYLVMEYLDGTSLGALARKGPLPVRDAAMFLAQACDALEEAHRLGIVHRDLKPDNLFLTTRPNGAPLVKVLDFGISRVPFSDDDDRRLTGTTDVMGTPHYMAPEQMAAARNADARSDVWALGVTLYEMLTGRLPFGGSNVTEICTRVLTTFPPPPRTLRPEIPAALDALVMSCLEKAPDRRCPSAARLAHALTPFASGAASVVAPPAPPPVHRSDEDATTLYRPGAPAPAAGTVAHAVSAPEGTAHSSTIAAAPLGAPPGAVPTGALGSITVDATTHIVRRRRGLGVVAGALSFVVLVLLGIGAWSRYAAPIAADASAASGSALVPASSASTILPTETTAAPPSSTTEPATTSDPTTPATNAPATTSATSALSPAAASADPTVPSTASSTAARPATTKGHTGGTTTVLKKTRK